MLPLVEVADQFLDLLDDLLVDLLLVQRRVLEEAFELSSEDPELGGEVHPCLKVMLAGSFLFNVDELLEDTFS